jgi:YfiH family protein
MPEQPGLFQEDLHHVYRFLPWQGLAWLEHGFGTRLSVEWGGRLDLVSLKQIHSNLPVFADGSHTGRFAEGDALLTDVPGVFIAVRTADCVPIIIVDPLLRAVAAIHAGWRGTAQNIAASTVSAMVARFGSQPAGLLAAIGPAIGPCCYEVGSEVADRFRQVIPELPDTGRKVNLDLAEANRRQLQEAGLPGASIGTAGICTGCHRDLFYSWRRDGTRDGRMVSAAGIRIQETERRGP